MAIGGDEQKALLDIGQTFLLNNPKGKKILAEAMKVKGDVTSFVNDAKQVKAAYELYKPKIATFTTKGRVYDQQTNKPIQGVKVEVFLGLYPMKLVDETKTRTVIDPITNKKEKQTRLIDNEIKKLIRLAIAESNKNNNSTNFALTPEGRLISTNFQANKGRLPWPVKEGVIIRRFGTQRHPVVRTTTINSNGISIATSPNSVAYSVFDGEVLSVYGFSGGNPGVLIRHGKYISNYQNLSSIFVKKGDKYNVKWNDITFIYDGKKLYTINPDDEEVTISTEDLDEESTITPNKILTFFEEGYEFKMDITQDVTVVDYYEQRTRKLLSIASIKQSEAKKPVKTGF